MVAERRTGDADDVQGLHERGVTLVSNWLLKQGYTLESVARAIEYDPQIVARRHGRNYHFAVRTGRWPVGGELECDELREELLAWARRHRAACCLVRVSVDSAIGGNRSRMVFSRL